MHQIVNLLQTIQIFSWNLLYVLHSVDVFSLQLVEAHKEWCV